MNIQKFRRPLDRRSGMVVLALLTTGIVVALAALNSHAPPARTSIDAYRGLTSVANAQTDSSVADPDSQAVRTSTPEPRRARTRYALVALVLLGGTGFALYLRPRSRARSATPEIRLIERQSIRQGQELRLVQVGTDRILIGVTPSQISVLHTVSVSGEEKVSPKTEPVEDYVPAVAHATELHVDSRRADRLRSENALKATRKPREGATSEEGATSRLGDHSKAKPTGSTSRNGATNEGGDISIEVNSPRHGAAQGHFARPIPSSELRRPFRHAFLDALRAATNPATGETEEAEVTLGVFPGRGGAR